MTKEVAVERANLILQTLVYGEQRMHGVIEHSIAIGTNVFDQCFKGQTLAAFEDNAEGFQDSADLVGDLDPHPDEPCTRAEHRSNGMAVETLYSDLTIPACPHD